VHPLESGFHPYAEAATTHLSMAFTQAALGSLSGSCEPPLDWVLTESLGSAPGQFSESAAQPLETRPRAWKPSMVAVDDPDMRASKRDGSGESIHIFGDPDAPVGHTSSTIRSSTPRSSDR
jgi:hypothetical protein